MEYVLLIVILGIVAMVVWVRPNTINNLLMNKTKDIERRKKMPELNDTINRRAF